MDWGSCRFLSARIYMSLNRSQFGINRSSCWSPLGFDKLWRNPVAICHTHSCTNRQNIHTPCPCFPVMQMPRHHTPAFWPGLPGSVYWRCCPFWHFYGWPWGGHVLKINVKKFQNHSNSRRSKFNPTTRLNVELKSDIRGLSMIRGGLKSHDSYS